MSSQNQSKADQYAARMMSGEISPQDEREIASWKASSTENSVALNAALEVWDSMEGLADDPEVLALLDQSTASRDDWTRDAWWQSVGVAAGVFAVGLAVVLTLMSDVYKPDPSVIRYSTVIGEQTELTLSDGSTLNLNTDTELFVRYTSGQRLIVLERGEVFFDVASDSSRPFTVELGTQSVTVLGTQFNIRKVPGYDVSVEVMEGVVAVHGRDEDVSPKDEIPKLTDKSQVSQLTKKYRLDAGTVVELKESAPVVTKVDKIDGQNHISWTKGVLRFEAAPLYEVVREINRYTQQAIVVEDPDVMNLKVYAIVHLDNLNAIYDGLESSLPIQVTRLPDRVIIRGTQ